MKALSVRQPWAWLIANGYKDIENRTWSTKYRGPVLIHASARRITYAEYDAALDVVIEYEKRTGRHVDIPGISNFRAAPWRGAIVGVATITGCIVESASPWFSGPYGFTLEAARPLSHRPMKGRLGFFETNERPHKKFALVVPESYQDATELEVIS